MSSNFEELSRARLVSLDDGAAEHVAHFGEEAAVWTINGGYLAAAAIRAAGDISGGGRPVSLSLQFLRGVKLAPTTLVSKFLHRGSATELLEGRIVQDGRIAALSHLWVHKSGPSPEMRGAVMPLVPHPDELRSQSDMRAGRGPQEPFYRTFEQRRMNTLDWGTRRHNLPQALSWVRYRDLPAPESDFLAAAMVLPLIDITGVAAACNGYGSNVLTSIAPTIQLSAHFYELAAVEEWLLTDATAECMGDGLLNSRVCIWAPGGALVAQGLTQMVFKSGQGAFVTGAASSGTRPEAGA
jgi:acyl-coenzyme A thioesterase PaaI-like protein